MRECVCDPHWDLLLWLFLQVKFIGSTEFAPGEWIGVELDLAEGRNNGIVNGVKYFDGREGHGLFVKKAQVHYVLRTVRHMSYYIFGMVRLGCIAGWEPIVKRSSTWSSIPEIFGCAVLRICSEAYYSCYTIIPVRTISNLLLSYYKGTAAAVVIRRVPVS